MYKIIDKTDTGKTRKLLEECSDNLGLFVCAHPGRVYDKCKAYDITPVMSCNYEEFIDYINGKNKDEQFDRIYIDELDRFLNVFSNGKIKGYSLTIDENDNKGNVKEKALNKLKGWLNG